MSRNKGNRRKSARQDNPAREQVLAVFADYAEQDVDKLFDFLKHCQINLEASLGRERRAT